MDSAAATSSTRAPTRRLSVAIPVALFVAAVLLRFYQLGAESFWFDEIIMVHVTNQDTASLLSQLFSSARAPLYPLLGHLWIQLFGTSEAAVRSLSAVCGSISVPLMFVVGRRLFNEKVGIISAAVMLLSPFQVYYAQEFRYYALTTLIALLSILALVEALDTGKWLTFVLFGLTGVAMFYTHPLVAGLFIGALGVYALVLFVWQKPTRRLIPAWLVSQVVIIVGASPTLLLRLLRSSERAGTAGASAESSLVPWWLSPPPVWEPVRTVANFLFLGFRYLPVAAMVIGGLALVAGLGVFIWRRGWQPWRSDVSETLKTIREKPVDWKRNAVLALFWFAGPLVLAYILSYTVLPTYVERYVSAAAPGLYVLVALGIVMLGRLIPQWLSAGVLALSLIVSLQQYYVQDIKEQWDEEAAYVAENIQPGDGIAFASNFGNMPETVTVRQSFEWYYPSAVPACDVDITQSDSAVLDDLAACRGSGDRVWLVTRWSADARVAELDTAIREASGGAGGLLEQHWYTGDIGLYLLKLPR